MQNLFGRRAIAFCAIGASVALPVFLIVYFHFDELFPPYWVPKKVESSFLLDETKEEGITFKLFRDSNNRMWVFVQNPLPEPAHYRLHVSIFCPEVHGSTEKFERNIEGRVYPNGGQESGLGRIVCQQAVSAKLSKIEIGD